MDYRKLNLNVRLRDDEIGYDFIREADEEFGDAEREQAWERENQRKDDERENRK